MSVEFVLDIDKLAENLRVALKKWQSSRKPRDPASYADLNTLFDFCRVNEIALVLLISGRELGNGRQRAFYRTTKRHGEKLENGNFAFQTIGVKPLSFKVSNEGCLYILNESSTPIVSYAPDFICGLLPSLLATIN